MIDILINDQTVAVQAPANLGDVLARHQADAERPFAVALNGEFVPKSRYHAIELNPGDALDIVSPVGGG